MKTLKTLIRDVDRELAGRTLPIIFLDTGIVIDVCKFAREEQLRQKGKSDLPIQELYADHFLMYLAGKYQTIVSPAVYQEIANHYNVRINGHTSEIGGTISHLIDKFAEDYNRLKQIIPSNGHDDTDRHNVYWVTKLACRGNKKKEDEGFSDVDRELLDTAVLFSRHFSEGGKVGTVAVFSSDEHILRGIAMLNGELGYHNLVSLTSKEK